MCIYQFDYIRKYNGRCGVKMDHVSQTNKSRRCCRCLEWTAVNLQFRTQNGQNKSCCNKCWIGSKTAIGFVWLVPLAIMVVLIWNLFAIDISLPFSSLLHTQDIERDAPLYVYYCVSCFDSLRIFPYFFYVLWIKKRERESESKRIKKNWAAHINK